MDPLTNRSIPDLCKEHRHLIDNVMLHCSEEIAHDPAQFRDDLFLLRFALSHKGNLEKTVDAVKQTIAWRVQHGERLKRLREGTEMPPGFETMQKYIPMDIHGTTAHGDVIFVMRTGNSNIKKLCDELGEAAITEYFVFCKEMLHALLDRKSREQRRIVKCVTIMDAKNSTAGNQGDRRWMTASGEGSKRTDLYYPQLLGAMVIVNLPLMLRALVAIAKLFMSKRSADKLLICPGKTRKDTILNCPVAKALIAPDQLPTFLGGTCACNHGRCVGGVANDFKSVVHDDDTTSAQDGQHTDSVPGADESYDPALGH